MLSAVKGHYDGNQIIMDEEIPMQRGQKVIITILDLPKEEKRTFDLGRYMGRGKKMFESDAQEYVKELRSNDRF